MTDDLSENNLCPIKAFSAGYDAANKLLDKSIIEAHAKGREEGLREALEKAKHCQLQDIYAAIERLLEGKK